MRGLRPGVSHAVGVGRRALGGFSEHRMSTFAAALAYRGLFGLFPFALIVAVLVGVFAPADWLVEEAGEGATENVPRQLEPVVEQGRDQLRPVQEVVEQAQEEARGGLLFFGVAIAIWSVRDLAGTLSQALNTVHGVTAARRGWKKLALSLASGPLLALAAILAVWLMLAGSRVAEGVAEVLGLRDLFVVLWGWLRIPMALGLIGAVLSVVYCYVPSERQGLGSVVPGAVVAVVAWAVTSVGFSVYLANFADYGVTYGSLGAAVGLLLYFYISASIVLLGAEINAALRRQTANAASRTDRADPTEPLAP